jgi:hypothetical protein
VPEGRPSFLGRRMLQITQNKQGRIEKYLLTFPVLNLMSDPILIGIPFIPLEAGNILELVFHIS